MRYRQNAIGDQVFESLVFLALGKRNQFLITNLEPPESSSVSPSEDALSRAQFAIF